MSDRNNLTKLDLTEERLRNTRAWAAARVGSLSGADVIVAAIDELLRYREIVGYELAEPAVEPTASHIDAFLAMALPRIAGLMQADPEDATPEGRELMLLAELADRYERQKYPEFSGRPVKPHRSGGGGPPAPEPPIEVIPRHPTRPAEPR